MFYPGTSSYDSYQRKMVTSISDYKLDFGAQYTQALNKKSSLTIGAVYSPKHKLNNDYTSIVIMEPTRIMELNIRMHRTLHLSCLIPLESG